MNKRFSYMKWISSCILSLYLSLNIQAGSYSPTPETTAVTFPENDTHAGLVAAVLFGVIVLIGIIQIATRKWQDRGDGDKG